GRDAEIAADDPAVLDQLLHDAADEIHRDREADSLGRASPAALGHGGVDADELAAGVDERASGISDIDRRVGLDEILNIRETELGPARRADDTERDGMGEAERVADREHN